ncbi:MAG: ion channel [Sphingobacteriales bacterium]
MSILKRKFNPEDDLGFGYQPVIKSQPLIKQDGSINVKRKGLPFFRPYDNYHKLITMRWTKFWLLILGCYISINIIFAFIYMAIGVQNLEGAEGVNSYQHFWDAFFFSAQTISTVGYGHISPRGMATNSVAALESMLGLLTFALATGMLYGRFARPSAKIVYSKNLLVAPYNETCRGLMFRLANLRRNTLIDLDIEIIFSYNEDVNGKILRRFYQLELERKKVSILTLNWTVVHPLDDKSPLKNMTHEDLEKTQASFAVLLRAFDDSFSQTVHSRTSYQHDDLVWGARFKPAFDRDEEGRIVLDLSRIDEFANVDLPEIKSPVLPETEN